MGNLMLTMMLALLVRESTGQGWAVSKDKAKNQKSIVLVMDSSAGTNQSRLVINSTYDDSIFISTYLKEGTNVTVVQDGKAKVNVNKAVRPLKKPRVHLAYGKFKTIEQKANRIMSQPIRDATQTSLEIRNLLGDIDTLRRSLKRGDEKIRSSLPPIAAKLRKFLRSIDSKSEIDDNLTKPGVEKSRMQIIEEKYKVIEQKANELMSLPTRDVIKTSVGIRRLLGDVDRLLRSLTARGDEGTTMDLESLRMKLRDFLKTIQNKSGVNKKPEPVSKKPRKNLTLERFKKIEREAREIMSLPVRNVTETSLGIKKILTDIGGFLRSLKLGEQLFRVRVLPIQSRLRQFYRRIQSKSKLDDEKKKKKKPVVKKPTAPERYREIERKAEEILSRKTRNVKQTSFDIKNLLSTIGSLLKSLTSKTQEGMRAGLSAITSKLNEHLKDIQTSDEDKKLKEMVNALEKSLNVTQANNKPPDNLENLDKISEMTRALAIKTGDVGLRNYALKIVQAFEIAMEPFRAKKPDLEKIVTSIREDYFDKKNATVLDGYINQLNELQTNVREPEKLALVKSLKREIVNLTEAIHVIDTVDDVLEAEQDQFEKLYSTKTIQKLMARLQDFSKTGRNKQMKSEAAQLYKETKERVKLLTDSLKKNANYMNILDAINKTLIDYNGLGGRDGLHMIRDKINFVLKKTRGQTRERVFTANDAHVKSKAKALLAVVESLDKKIDDVLKVFDNIEKKIGVPDNKREADALELAISQIKQISKTVHDQAVATRAMKIIGNIEKFLNSYKFQNQMKKIEEALNDMNETLAIAESEKEVDEDRERLEKIESSVMKMKTVTPVQKGSVTKMLQKIDGIKRTIPGASQTNGIFMHEVKELVRLLNGLQNKVLPEIANKREKAKKSMELLKKFKQVDTDGMRDRIYIVYWDHIRIKNGLNSIKTDLQNKFKLSYLDLQATREFKSVDDTLDRMFDLERLQENPATNDLLKKAFITVHDVLHANDTLKQLQRTIIFNTRLLNSNDKGQRMTEGTKPPPVPITKVSLFPLIPDDVDEAKVPKVEKTATKASDLDRAVVKNASSKNSSEITAAPQ